MPDVFSPAPSDDDSATPGTRVAGALTGSGEDAPAQEESPQAAQPQGAVDELGQSYTVPAGSDEGTTPQPAGNDAPVSADTKPYTTPAAPIPPPALAKPANYDDHSGTQAQMVAQKTAESQENTKPSVWRRVGAALAGGAVAFGSRNPQEGINASRQILNAPLENAQARWATQEAPIQAKLNADAAADEATTRANQTTDQANRLAETNYSNQLRGQQDAATEQLRQAQVAKANAAVDGEGWKADDPNNPLGGYTATTIGGKTIHSATAPAAVQNSAEYRIANAAAKGHPFTPEQQQILRGGGKLTFRPPPNPRQPSAEEISLGQARAAFIKENGRQPQTLDEQNQVEQAARGTLTGGGDGPNTPGTAIAQSISEKNAWIDKHQLQSDLYGDTDPKTGEKTLLHPKGTFIADDGHEMSAKEVQDQLELLRNKLNNSYVMRKSGTMVDAQGNTVTNRFSRNPQTATPQQGQQQSPAESSTRGRTQVSLSKARALPINKGRSDAQIRADIMAHGHQVAP